MTTGLELATGLAIAPDGRIFVGERWKGRIRIIQDEMLRPEPFAEFSVAALQETGLLGLALHPDYPTQPFLYAYHTYRAPDGSLWNRVVRLREAEGRAAETTVIFDQIPAASIHNGGVLGFGPDGKLYVTTGDATQRELSQDSRTIHGKVLRLNPDGSIPADNPIPGSPIYTLGHRNIFGLAFHPETGRAYITENGPDRNDEVNLLKPGGNYGWPLVTGVASDPRFIDPLVTFTPNIAPTNAAFYTGPEPRLQGDLFFGDWNTGSLRRVVLECPNYDRILNMETALTVGGQGIIGLAMGPDGYIYLTTPTTLWRVAPQPRFAP
ncbi:MAG: PQQ-dependent sugar dehydrogenase [Chloroflexi bacterium]|nr:PQQ-dependent sugar dehydrogenase [Chloroflexota bacterium]